MTECELAGHRLDVRTMARAFADYAYAHGGTLRQYDRAGWIDRASPRDRVIAEDLGRMQVFAARVSAPGAVTLLEHDAGRLWQEMPETLDLLARPDEQLDRWLQSDCVTAAHELFEHYPRGPQKGNRPAWASKLLHLKWPGFYPILDGRIKSAYRVKAELLAQELELTSPRYPAGILAYWAAIRADLTAEGFLPALQLAVEQATAHVPHADASRRLIHLTPVRLADILTWSPS